MTMADFLEQSPVIAAVKNEEGLCHALEKPNAVIFLLFGTVCNVRGLVERIKEAGKIAIVHVDLVAGLSPKEVSVDFIRSNTRADGIISTKSALVRHAHDVGLICIQRSFVVDSIALAALKKQLAAFHPDAVEIMPGMMPKIIRNIRGETALPLIAGGLLQSKEDIIAALDSGANAVSTTREEMWTV